MWLFWNRSVEGGGGGEGAIEANNLKSCAKPQNAPVYISSHQTTPGKVKIPDSLLFIAVS